MKRSLILFLALSTIPALAQQAPQPPAPRPASTSVQPKTAEATPAQQKAILDAAKAGAELAAAAPAQAPSLTELQKAKLENLQLKFTLLQQQQTSLQGEYQTLVQSIVAEHPGFQWNPQSGSLVAVPAAPKK